MLAENYTYEIAEKGNVIWVSLFEKSGALRSVNFKLIKMRPNNEGIIRHMESLTDACCEQWFPKPKKQK